MFKYFNYLDKFQGEAFPLGYNNFYDTLASVSNGSKTIFGSSLGLKSNPATGVAYVSAAYVDGGEGTSIFTNGLGMVKESEYSPMSGGSWDSSLVAWKKADGSSSSGAFTSIEKVLAANPFKIYPNPATNYLVISNTNNSNPYSLCIYSITGQQVYKNTLSKQIEQADISTLPAGIYLYQIKTDSGVVSGKFEKK